VITQNQELVVTDLKGGAGWRVRLDARAVTAPLLAGDRVFVMTLDRAVRAFDGATGAPLWNVSKPGEPLALDVPGVLTPMQNTLLTSRGSRLVAIDPDRGESRWELSLAASRGTNEVERLSDLVGPMVRVAPQGWCARAFQAGVSCVDAARPALTWQRKQTGHRELAADGQHLYGADATDRLSAWKLGNGDTVWSSDAWAFRQLTGMASLPQALVFGDAQGWLHWVGPSTGTTLARIRPDGTPITLTPVVVAGTVIVTTARGAVYAYRLPG
jgi:outer membrane protein assembly factor BamB